MIIKKTELEQVVMLRITDRPLPRNARRAVEFNFEKGTPSLKIKVLNNEQPKAKKMIKPKGESKRMDGESIVREIKDKGRTEDIANQDLKKEDTMKKDQRKDKKDNGYT